MDTVTNIDSRRPHIIIATADGNTHMVPRVTFERLASGALSIDDIDGRDAVIRAVIKDWLETLE